MALNMEKQAFFSTKRISNVSRSTRFPTRCNAFATGHSAPLGQNAPIVNGAQRAQDFRVGEAANASSSVPLDAARGALG
ncbi:hypothetical protein Poly24_23310 [Rosistilla carotiformis]|uniref:Uncharacterized protein n=1 Tax=Rosistilla carotiformis TaxID=2528017 RepID=A0A518JSU7_9BACT|nr:hypothetical protein Poly24_23310 [Rosistilla carotiformis]